MVENNEYTLPLTARLTNNDLHADSYTQHFVHEVICYHIDNSSRYPFIQIMLYNNGASLRFPSLDPMVQSPNISEILKNEMSFVLGLTTDEQIKPQGFLDHESVRYFFIDISEINVGRVLLQRNSAVWFGLISELINNKTIYDILVDKYVCDFIADNYDLFLLNNPTGSRYPLPDVGYHGSHLKITEFQNEFGVNKQKRNLGEYYYYTYSLQDAIQEGHEWHGSQYSYASKGINRVALLVDNMLYLNEQDLENNDCVECIEGFMENYDSIFVYSKNKSFIIMKDVHRQVSLSYHKIEENMLQESWIE